MKKRKLVWAAFPALFALSAAVSALSAHAGVGAVLDQAEKVLVTDVVGFAKAVLFQPGELVQVTDLIGLTPAKQAPTAELVTVTDTQRFLLSIRLTVAEGIKVTDILPDSTPPTVTLTGKPANPTGSSGATFSWTIADPDDTSGFTSFCKLDGGTFAICLSGVTYTPLADGLHTFTIGAADPAGNRSPDVSYTWLVDTTPPTTQCQSPDTAWHAANQSLACTAVDAGSGLANPADGSFTLSTSVPAGTETASASTGSRQVCDKVNNCATAGPITGVKVDRKGPTIVCDQPDALWHASDVSLTCTATDASSGLATPADASFPLSTSVPAGTETANASTGSRQVCDAVGNCTTAGPTNGIKVDRKPPTITATAITTTDGKAYSGGTWTNQGVKVTFACGDGGSGVNLATVTGPVTLSGDGKDQSVTGNCADNLGYAASTTFTNIDIDTTPPTITYQGQTPAADANGWNNTSVTLTWACADALSGPVAPTVSATVTTEGANQSATGTCRDNAGNAASRVQAGINIDKTPPVLTASATTVDGKPYTGGTWTNQNVIVTFTCTDTLSGVATVTSPVTVSTEGANQSASGTCTDKAGNAATPVTFGGVNIDKTPPTTTFTATAGPLNGRQLLTVTANVLINPGAISFDATCFDSFGLNAALSATSHLAPLKAIKYGTAQVVPGQPLPNPALTNTITGSSGSVTFSTSGAYVLTFAAIDQAGNQEATQTRWIFVNARLGIGCATTTVPVSSLPSSGTVTVSGTIHGQYNIPFSFSFSYPSKEQ